MNARQKAKKYKRLYENEKKNNSPFIRQEFRITPINAQPVISTVIVNRYELHNNPFVIEDAQNSAFEKLCEGIRSKVSYVWKLDPLTGYEICQAGLVVGKFDMNL